MSLVDMTLRDRRNAKVEVGDRVMLCRPHPRAGEIGTYAGIERINATGKWGSLVRFEDGSDGCYVLNADFWEKLTP